MQKVKSLILLVKSLSKSEKKSIQLNSQVLKGDKKYMELYELIENKGIVDADALKKEFEKKRSSKIFHPTVNYLYDFILDLLLKVSSKKNDNYSLYIDIVKAKILHERELDLEYNLKLENLETRCKENDNFTLLLEIQQLKIESIRDNQLLKINDENLFDKIYETNVTLKILRQINEQSILYELLIDRINNTENLKSKNKDLLNDLVISEISLNSNLKNNIFKIDENHLLFQAQYLIFVNDYESALNTFIELDELFSRNESRWISSPNVYLRVLEGILNSLHGINKFDEMAYFIQKIDNITSSYQGFLAEKKAVIFIYKIIILLSIQDYQAAMEYCNTYSKDTSNNINLLTPYRYVYVHIYIVVILIKNKEFHKARKIISPIINSKSYEGFIVFRVIQLLGLIINYELKDTNMITSKIRSIKRINKIYNLKSILEDILFPFLETSLENYSKERKIHLKQRIEDSFEMIKLNPVEYNIVRFFDFKDWMLNHLKV